MSLPVLLFSPASPTSLIKQSIFSYESFRLSLFPFVTAFISSLSMVFIFSIRASPPKALTAAAFFSNVCAFSLKRSLCKWNSPK